MSAFLEKSNAIKARLEAIPELSNIDVLVDHQKDIKSEFKLAIAKIKGGVVTLLRFVTFSLFCQPCHRSFSGSGSSGRVRVRMSYHQMLALLPRSGTGPAWHLVSSYMCARICRA